VNHRNHLIRSGANFENPAVRRSPLAVVGESHIQAYRRTGESAIICDHLQSSLEDHTFFRISFEGHRLLAPVMIRNSAKIGTLDRETESTTCSIFFRDSAKVILYLSFRYRVAWRPIIFNKMSRFLFLARFNCSDLFYLRKSRDL